MTAADMTPDGYVVHYVDNAPTAENNEGVAPNGKHMYIGGTNNVESWWVNGLLHRNDGAAFIHKNDEIGDIEYWYQNGHLHRDGDEPAVITANFQRWYRDGLLHRVGAPASDGDFDVRPYPPPFQVQMPELLGSPPYDTVSVNPEQIWAQNGVYHRTDGPAIYQKRSGYDYPETSIYYVNGVITRDPDEGPAVTIVNRKAWMVDGEFYRNPLDGPAVIVYDDDGTTITSEEFWVEGEKFNSRDEAIDVMGENIKG